MFTQDQHRQELPARPFPKFKHAPYLYRAWDVMMENKKVAFPKSRQMMLTWVVCCFALWQAQFQRNSYWFFISQKQKKANNLIARTKFIYQHQPFRREVLDLIHTITWNYRDIGTRSVIPFYPPADEIRKFGYANVQSKLEALSEDSDDIRMETATGVIFDEVAFQEGAEDNHKAILPTLGETGWLIDVSSPNGKNHFYRLCYDLDEEEVV